MTRENFRNGHGTDFSRNACYLKNSILHCGKKQFKVSLDNTQTQNYAMNGKEKLHTINKRIGLFRIVKLSCSEHSVINQSLFF